MAMNNEYGNQLRGLLSDPGSFSMTPGARFAADQGLQAASRKYAAQGMGGSGNVLAALTQLGTGYASQDYANQRDFLGKMVGQEQTYGLGEEQNRLTGIRDSNAYSLGQAQNANTAQRNAWDYDLGKGQNANNATRNANDFTMGTQQNNNTARANDQNFGLGMVQAGNTAQNNWWNNQNQQWNNWNQSNQNWWTNQNNQFSNNTNRGTATNNALRSWVS